MAKLLHYFAVTYAVILTLLALYAWSVDIALLHSEREHLFPDVLLFLASLPSSMTTNLVPDLGSATPLVALAVLTLCAVFQAGAVLMFSRFVSNRSANNSDRR